MPQLGQNLQPRHVPWPRIEPVTLCFVGWCATKWATLVRAGNSSSCWRCGPHAQTPERNLRTNSDGEGSSAAWMILQWPPVVSQKMAFLNGRRNSRHSFGLIWQRVEGLGSEAGACHSSKLCRFWINDLFPFFYQSSAPQSLPMGCGQHNPNFCLVTVRGT